MGVAIPFFQQVTGIKVIMFYVHVFFNTIGFGQDASLYSAIIVGAVNVVAILISLDPVDKYGYRFFFLESNA
jgi:hypothetical protein